jgi:hypothetical protein
MSELRGTRGREKRSETILHRQPSEPVELSEAFGERLLAVAAEELCFQLLLVLFCLLKEIELELVNVRSNRPRLDCSDERLDLLVLRDDNSLIQRLSPKGEQRMVEGSKGLRPVLLCEVKDWPE